MESKYVVLLHNIMCTGENECQFYQEEYNTECWELPEHKKWSENLRDIEHIYTPDVIAYVLDTFSIISKKMHSVKLMTHVDITSRLRTSLNSLLFDIHYPELSTFPITDPRFNTSENKFLPLS
jgi:hypothetical protein